MSIQTESYVWMRRYRVVRKADLRTQVGSGALLKATVEDRMHLHVGDDAVVTVSLSVNGTKTDPTGISITVLSPAGTSTTYVYGVDPELSRFDTGVYKATVDCTVHGLWRYTWTSTGSAKGSTQGFFDVSEPLF